MFNAQHDKTLNQTRKYFKQLFIYVVTIKKEQSHNQSVSGTAFNSTY